MYIDVDGTPCEAQRVFCIGCNYAEHVKELHGFEEIPQKCKKQRKNILQQIWRQGFA